MNDIDIVKRIQAGDNESFSCLVEKYYKQLLNFIYRLVGDERVVEDIGQEVFLSVYKSLRNFDLSRGTPFSAWLFITARNRCFSELRKTNRLTVSIEDTSDLAAREKSPEDAAIAEEQREAIEASLAQLTEPYRRTLIESLRGDSQEEIALRGRVSLGTVKSRLFRARGKMRSMLSDHFGGIDHEKL